jgi:hypothetical protein
MSKVQLTVIGAGLALFGAGVRKRGGGDNFRIRLVGGVLSLKPSSRPNCVAGEMFGLGIRAGDGLMGTFSIDGFPNFPVESYAMVPTTLGWHMLVTPTEAAPATITFVAIPDAVAAAPAAATPATQPAPAATQQLVKKAEKETIPEEDLRAAPTLEEMEALQQQE